MGMSVEGLVFCRVFELEVSKIVHEGLYEERKYKRDDKANLTARCFHLKENVRLECFLLSKKYIKIALFSIKHAFRALL